MTIYKNNFDIVDYKSKLTLEKVLHITNMYLDPEYEFIIKDMKRGIEVVEFLKKCSQNKKANTLVEKLKEKNVIK